MSTALLDPWADAASIASRLSLPGACMVLIIGAEAWCQICRTLRPVFESLAEQESSPDDAWLWLDLEEHAEFLDDFIPENLPLMIAYRGDRLSHALVPDEKTIPALAALLGETERIEYPSIPDLRARFMFADWAA